MVAYEGNEPYVFISYAHKDSEIVLPLIEGLQNRGFRLWYDGGVELGNEWPDFIAEHLEQCACVLTFVSRNFGESHNCRQEFTFAQNLHKDNSIIYLEAPKLLRAGLRMQLVNLHARYYADYSTAEAFLDDLSAAKVLKPCLGVIAVPGTEKPAEFDAEKQDKQAASIERKIDLVNRTLSKLATQKYGQGRISASTSETPSEPSAEELYNRATALSKKQGFIEAYILYKKAAEMGYAPAQNSLGYCYQHGEGVPWDREEAVKWYTKSADQGFAEAQFNLGLCYEDGRGVTRKKAEARKWYQKAAEQGHKKAAVKLKTLK